MNEITIFLIYFVACFVLTQFFHEVGHAVKLSKYLNKKVKIRFNKKFYGFEVGEEEDYEKLTKAQAIDVYANGIMFGLYSLMLFAVIEPIIAILYLIPYGFSCRYDIKNLRKLTKKF